MPEVRQSSFALLGDLTKACFENVKPCIGMWFLKRLEVQVINKVTYPSPWVKNNASPPEFAGISVWVRKI